MIEKLLGHEVQYDIPEYHGDNKKCYFGVVSDNFVIDEDNIKQYMIQVADNFNYRGKKPNFDRDRFLNLILEHNYQILK